jgi:hypothetical protein
MPPRSSPLTTFHSLDQDVFDVMTSQLNLRDVANIAKTSKKNRDAVRETRLDRTVRELKRLNCEWETSARMHVGRRPQVYNADCPDQVLPPGCTSVLPKERPETLCCLAAAFGRLDLLIFLHGQGFKTDNVLAMAGGAGHLEILEWAWENGIVWPPETANWYVRDQDLICKYAMAGGHLEVLKWARAHGAPWPSGQIDVGQMDKDLTNPDEKEVYMERKSISHRSNHVVTVPLHGANHVEILNYMYYDDGPPALKYIPGAEFPYNEHRITNAREESAEDQLELAYCRRNLDVVKWLTASGIVLDQLCVGTHFIHRKFSDIVYATLGKTLELGEQLDIIKMLDWLFELMLEDFPFTADALFTERGKVKYVEVNRRYLFKAGKEDGNMLLYQWGVNNCGVNPKLKSEHRCEAILKGKDKVTGKFLICGHPVVKNCSHGRCNTRGHCNDAGCPAHGEKNRRNAVFYAQTDSDSE